MIYIYPHTAAKPPLSHTHLAHLHQGVRTGGVKLVNRDGNPQVAFLLAGYRSTRGRARPYAGEGLEGGWVVEVRTRESSSKTKRDPPYGMVGTVANQWIQSQYRSVGTIIEQ